VNSAPSFIPLLTVQDLELSARILLALALGAVLGYERERSHRPAGLRTHMLVSAGAAAFTVASIYAFVQPGASTDPGRIAAQIVTGVGFLGAGTILRTGAGSVYGLTTASSIWLVAAIGLLAGAGMYWLAIFTTIIGGVTLYFLKFTERRWLGHTGYPDPEDKNDGSGDETGT
jgi:putative Mg2+ transporter-C (MgtC) family protein